MFQENVRLVERAIAAIARAAGQSRHCLDGKR